MTEFEQQLLQHLQKQADQLTALSLSQSQTTAALLKISEQQAAIFRELSKAPEGESMKNAMAGLLKPLEGNLSALEGRSASCWTCPKLSNDCPRLRPRRNSPSKKVGAGGQEARGHYPEQSLPPGQHGQARSARKPPHQASPRPSRPRIWPSWPGPRRSAPALPGWTPKPKPAGWPRRSRSTLPGRRRNGTLQSRPSGRCTSRNSPCRPMKRPWPVWPSTKPTLMPSRCCWAVRSGRKRASASSRDAANGLEWQNLRDGRYPFTEREKKPSEGRRTARRRKRIPS